jgi:tetratricopeptide (TPR) repeat protein
MAHISQLRSSANRAEAMGHLNTAADLLTELTDSAKSIENKQQVYAMLGQTHLYLREMDKAVNALKSAVAADPDSRMAKQLKGLITKIEAQQ